MALKNRDAFNALEDVVGTEYITEEPAILDAYAFQWGAELFTNTPFLPRSGAILLPQKTEEIRAIVKICNKYQVRYKAITNGWGFYSALGLDENAIHIDMRRMNRIIEINEKSMYAVVEPYVTCAQLQGETMKRGFNINIVCAGSNTCALPITAHQGTGHSGLTTSVNDRNVLAVEWVLPDGTILKLGTLGSGLGWFCGDGPGPSLRGILRGPQTVMGGLGIYTKAATKIYHWNGPPQPEIEGSSPYYRLKELPKNHNIHCPIFPSWQKLIEAAMKISESEIAMLLTIFSWPMISEGLSGNADESAELLSKLREESKGKPGFLVIISSSSDSEFNYKEKVLAQIMSEIGGEFLGYFEKDAIKREYMWTITKVTAPVREVFRASGRFLGAIGDSALLPTSAKMMLDCLEFKKEYQQKGVIRSDEGPECIFATVYEHGHTGHAEQLVQIHPTGEGWRALMEYTDKCENLAIEKHYTAPVTVWGDRGHDKWGPHLCNYHLWLRKFKKAFDPNGVSEAAMYISAKE
jgi:glycolate oxidase